MIAGNIMSGRVAECTEDTKLDEVFELIRQCDHGIVVVVDSLVHRVPIGVVSERSICEQIIARGKNPRNLVAASVMDSRIKKVSTEDVVEAIDDTAVTAIVVVDDKRQVCGLVPKERIIKSMKPASKKAYEPVPEISKVVPPSSHRISEIPAFGWA